MVGSRIRGRTSAVLVSLGAGALTLASGETTNAQVTSLPGSVRTTTTIPKSVPRREPGTVRVVDSCPPGDTNPSLIESGEGAVGQSRMFDTIEQATNYASTQPSFAEIRFGGKDNATVVVSFTGDLQRHADALTALVNIPSGVVVCKGEQTASERVALANELVTRAGSSLVGGSLTPSSGPPVVVLRADSRDVADEIVRAYGSRVQVVLGEFAYPDPTVARLDGAELNPAGLGRCGAVPTPSSSSKLLRWSVAKPLRIHSGGSLQQKVTWKNIGKSSVTYESGDPIVGVVTAIGSTQVLARYSGAIAGIGKGGTLRPGKADSALGLLSTASCDSKLGYALPPGKYSVRFLFGSLATEQYVSNPIPLTITKDRPPKPKAASISPVTLPGATGMTLPPQTTTG
jgi:hypothetical protein